MKIQVSLVIKEIVDRVTDENEDKNLLLVEF